MIEVLNPGTHSTIQDKGRLKFREQGVPVGGAMDLHALILANHLLQHTEIAPVIEFAINGPTLYFYSETYIVLTGAEFHCKLNGKVISHATPIYSPADSTLEIGHVFKGNYGYLCVLGGFSTEKTLESASFHPTLLPNAKLKKEMKLVYIKTHFNTVNFYARVIPVHDKFCRTKMDVYPGPEFNLLSEEQQSKLLNQKYFVKSSSNRMAVIMGNTSGINAPEIITAPVQPGTVQLTPSGDLIVLMRDAHTTGGYSRVLQLTDYAMNSLSQCEIGESYEASFHLI